MKYIVLIIFIISVVILGYFIIQKINSNELKEDTQNTVEIPSSIDQKEYLVSDQNNKQDAADMLSIIYQRIMILKDYLEKNADSYPKYKPYIKLFLERIPNVILTENAPNGQRTSYTVEKGEKIALCIRSAKTSEIHDLNLVMYVVLHELAHVACPEIGHTPLFKEIFIFLLQVAISLNLYEKDNYQKNPREYCGLNLTENLFD